MNVKNPKYRIGQQVVIVFENDGYSSGVHLCVVNGIRWNSSGVWQYLLDCDGSFYASEDRLTPDNSLLVLAKAFSGRSEA